MKVFVTGLSSFLGRHFLEKAPRSYEICGTYFANPFLPVRACAIHLDTGDTVSVAAALNEFAPHAVVNIAALSSVSECERYPERAYAVNAAGAVHVAEWCSEHGAQLIHISTDMVFDGEKEGFYDEKDIPRPVTVYGRTKLQGEEGVTRACPAAAIVRPALMYGRNVGTAHGFLHWLATEAKKGSAPLFIDQYRTPVFADDVCDIINSIIAAPGKGLYHLGGPDRMNRLEMGRKYLAEAKLPLESIREVRLNEVHPGYVIQKNLSLSSEKVKRKFNYAFTPYDHGIKLAAGARWK